MLSRLLLQRSLPSLLTTAACSGLRPAPDCRPRRAFLHLSYSYAPPFGPAMLVTHNPRRTKQATFSLTNSRRIKVPMMRQTGRYYVVQRRGYRAIRLPYLGGIGMIVVVPDEVDGLKKVGNRLSGQELSEIFRAAREEDSDERIDLMMPRFKTTYHASLIQPFEKLGMR